MTRGFEKRLKAVNQMTLTPLTRRLLENENLDEMQVNTLFEGYVVFAYTLGRRFSKFSRGIYSCQHFTLKSSVTT